MVDFKLYKQIQLITKDYKKMQLYLYSLKYGGCFVHFPKWLDRWKEMIKEKDLRKRRNNIFICYINI